MSATTHGIIKPSSKIKSTYVPISALKAVPIATHILLSTTRTPPNPVAAICCNLYCLEDLFVIALYDIHDLKPSYLGMSYITNSHSSSLI